MASRWLRAKFRALLDTSRRAQCERGRIVRIALGLMSGLLLAACAGRDPIVSMSETSPAGNWQIEKSTDRVTGQPISNAMLMSLASHSSQPFPHKSMLQLQCFKSEPIVRVLFDTKIGSSRNAEVGYRFDDKPGKETAAVRFVDDFKSFVIECPLCPHSLVHERSNQRRVQAGWRRCGCRGRLRRLPAQAASADSGQTQAALIICIWRRARATRSRCPAGRGGSRCGCPAADCWAPW
jgi:hypothetical protein